MASDKTILFFLGEEEIKTMVDALINAYGAADLHARALTAENSRLSEEKKDLYDKLDKAEKRLVVMDAEYADLDEERAAWKEKYEKLAENIDKAREQEGN